MPATLSPRNDVVFKLLFADARNRGLLRALLNAVLQPSRPIVSVDVINPEIHRDSIDDRGLVLDILAVHDDGTRTDVEMQAYPQPALPERALYHWARLFRDGIGRGDDFAALRPCRVIFFLAHRQLPGTRVHSTFGAREKHDGTLLSDALEIHTVELPKLGDMAPTTEPADAAVLDWARFLAAETDEERRRMATHNPDIDQANEALERLSQDPTARVLAQWREDQLRLLQVERAEVRRLGREEGLRTAIETLCQVLALELSPPRRAALAAMRGAELTALLEHLGRERAWPQAWPPGA